MPTTLDFTCKMRAATQGSGALLFSAAEFKEQFLWGIPLTNPATNVAFTDAAFTAKMQAAQTSVENLIDTKLTKQYILERKDYVADDFRNWGYIQTNYFINRIVSLVGYLNNTQVAQYPMEWMTIHSGVGSRSTDYSRNLYLIPNGQSAAVTYQNFTSMYAYIGLAGAKIIPNFWAVEYITGFDEVPADIINTIGKLVAIQILPVIELIITGAGNNTGVSFAAASTSISIDGISQNIGKVNGGNIFQQRLQQYAKEVVVELQQLKMIYSGMKFDVC